MNAENASTPRTAPDCRRHRRQRHADGLEQPGPEAGAPGVPPGRHQRGPERREGDRHGEQEPVWPREPAQQRECRCAHVLPAPDVIERARRAQEEDRLRVDRAVEDGKRVGRQQRHRPRRLFGITQGGAREAVHVDECPQAGAKDEELAGPERVPANQAPAKTHQHRQRRHEGDVLLAGDGGIPPVSVGRDPEVPARIVAGRQVEELVLVEPEGRAAVPIAERPHGEEPDEQHRQPRRGPEGRDGAHAVGGPPSRDAPPDPQVERLVPPDRVANEYDGQRQQEDSCAAR